MNRSTDNSEEMIARYLLGELPDEEQRRLEETYLADDEVFSELLRVEAELIDRYLDDRLTPSQRERFEKYFLQSDLRRRRVELAGWSSGRGAPPDGAPPEDRATASCWRRLIEWLGIGGSSSLFAL